MIKHLFAFLFISASLTGFHSVAFANSSHKIVVLVRDSAITEFQVQQRINLKLMSSKAVNERLRATLKSKAIKDRWMKYIQEARPTSKEEVMKLQKRFIAGIRNQTVAGVAKGMRKKALDELINERLMVVTAKDNNIVVGEDEVSAQIIRIAKSNAKGAKSDKEAKDGFYKFLRSRNVGPRTFQDKIRASIAWQKLVRQKFGREVQFSDRDVELQLGIDGASETDKKIQFNLARIILDLGKTNSEKEIVDNMVRANSIRERFNGCSNMQSLVAPYKNAKVESMRLVTLKDLPSPVNLIVSNMKVGQITPPQSTDKGLEMYAVCERKQVTLDDKQRSKVIADLRQKAFQLRSQRYLKDIRSEAHIEYRD